MLPASPSIAARCTIVPMIPVLLLLLLCLGGPAAAGGLYDEIPFERHAIDLGAAETCVVADINGDGRPDIVSGDHWFEAPAWKRYAFRELGFTNDYIDAFSDLATDVNGDGAVDLVTVTWFARKIVWYENPGKGQGMWKEHSVDSGFNTEFAFLVDLDNDGQARELLPQTAGKAAQLAWYRLEGGRFVKKIVHPSSFGHGIGAGDVNRDGRTDILTPKGWWEAPPDPVGGDWIQHAGFEKFEFPHLGFMHVLDVNGDGLNDVITSYAHDYGLLWLEQKTDGDWVRHMIDESWSQAHAVTVTDLNGDGRMDLVTGKRFHAHNGKDPGGREPLGVYWYESRKAGDGGIVWKRHIIDYSSRAGGGMQIPVADLDGDGDLDIVTPGKGGLFLFENTTRR